jgi:hypothetical protein
MYSGRSEVKDSAVAGQLVWGVVENYTMRQNKRAKRSLSRVHLVQGRLGWRP